MTRAFKRSESPAATRSDDRSSRRSGRLLSTPASARRRPVPFLARAHRSGCRGRTIAFVCSGHGATRADSPGRLLARLPIARPSEPLFLSGQASGHTRGLPGPRQRPSARGAEPPQSGHVPRRRRHVCLHRCRDGPQRQSAQYHGDPVNVPTLPNSRRSGHNSTANSARSSQRLVAATASGIGVR
jgi:hypothetical protein